MAAEEKPLGYDYLVKLMLIGDSVVGKSSLLLRFSDDLFDLSFSHTIGIDFKLRTIVLDGKKIKLQLLDTAGQERFRTITTAHYRNTMGMLLVYDVTKEDSFNNITGWLRSIDHHVTGKTVNKLLLGNKCDLEDKRVVSKEQGKKLAEELGMGFFETSARTKQNVEQAFIDIARAVLKRLIEQSVKIAGSAREEVLFSTAPHAGYEPPPVPPAIESFLRQTEREERAAIATATGAVADLETRIQTASSAENCAARLAKLSQLMHQLNIQDSTEEFHKQAGVLVQIKEARAQVIGDFCSSSLASVPEYCANLWSSDFSSLLKDESDFETEIAGSAKQISELRKQLEAQEQRLAAATLNRDSTKRSLSEIEKRRDAVLQNLLQHHEEARRTALDSIQSSLSKSLSTISEAVASYNRLKSQVEDLERAAKDEWAQTCNLKHMSPKVNRDHRNVSSEHMS